MASIKLKFVVEELSNVLTQYDQIKVYRSITGIGGVYNEITGPGTRVDLAIDQTLYEYIDATGDPSYWYKFAYFNSITLAEGSLSDAISGEDTGSLYCTVQYLRDEGIPDTVISDARAITLIRRASAYIERVTGRWFEPRTRTFRLRGNGTNLVRIGVPIIKIDSIYIVSGRGASLARNEISVDDVLVFNRHLTEGLTDPDDRDFPCIEFISSWSVDYPGQSDYIFPNVSQSVELTGLFGYTELEPSDPVGETSDGSQIPLSYGTTPELIQHACALLVARELYGIGDAARRSSWRERYRVQEEKTSDQSYKLTPLNTLGMHGSLTGDYEIDSILTQYMQPIGMGAV